METNEIVFRASWVMVNGGTKTANNFRLVFGFSCLAALEVIHDELHDTTILIMRYAEGLTPTGYSSEPRTPAVSGQTTRERFAAFSNITIRCFLVLHDTALALELCDGS